jgi:hypothetical protein
LQSKYAIPLKRAMSRYRDIKNATAEVVGVRLVTKASTARAHAAIRDVIVANPTLNYQQIANLLGCSRWLIYRVAVEFGVRRARGGQPGATRGGGAVKRRKYFDWEQAFHFIFQNADRDGIWHGDAASLAAEFEVSEDTADEVLDELRDKRLIERLSIRTYFLSKWRERDDPGLQDQ